MARMLLILMASSTAMLLNCKVEMPVEETVSEEVTEHPIAPVTIIVTYDNNPYAERAKQLVEGDVLLVMGGFHLRSKSEREIQEIISSFKELGVVHVGPCHCSGDRARRLFQEAYGEKFLQVGVGRIIIISEQGVQI